ncbi:MAG TPA: Stp1/IreP family PP2C-type Ser/Thr phosphatase [Thermomicrobiales bacterium]|nr:Stp1/IreP family PP2C-type Ser/Thr phosphatase [Thermomicrobiales bacterium]HRA32109.1 Stp1/IreP family PP2C-type Ser/Thr phosphatase [Thermomicrobiales bacterium]
MEDSRLIVGAATDPGPVREANEDTVYHDVVANPIAGDLLVLAVADGMGGYQRGEVASSMAVDALRDRFTTADTSDVVVLLKQAFRQANESIFNGGSAAGEHNMMGTTLVAGVVKDMDLAIGNIGDSRAYLVRARTLNQITNDHSLVAEQVAMGAMTHDEARGSHHKNIITRALGHRERVDVDIFELTLLPDDRLLFSTDGLHDHLEDDEMTTILLTMSPEDAAKEMVDRAIRAGSTDNVTALCVWAAPVSVLDAPPAAAPAEARMNVLLTALVLLGLVIFIAIVGYIVLAT